MRILQICNKSPLPPKEGGPIAMFNLAEALLNNGHKVDVLAVETDKFPIDANDVKRFENENYKFNSEYIDTGIKPIDAFLALLTSKPYHVQRFIDRVFRRKLFKIIKENEYDVIIFETIYVTPYIHMVKKFSNAICVLRTHNIENQIWSRIAANENNFLKRFYIKHLTSCLKKYEKSIVNQFHALACISPAEVEYFQSENPNLICKHVPFSFDSQVVAVDSSKVQNVFYHLGSMDWIPNLEGMKWFLNEVLPLLKESGKDLKIKIAGRNMPDWINKYNCDILEVVGEVDSVNDFIENKSCLFVPLFSGSGVRIKIIEAMNFGKAVISTSLGAEGINYTDGKNIIIANDKFEFANAFINLHENPDLAINLGLEAKSLITNFHSFDVTFKAFDEIIKSVCN